MKYQCVDRDGKRACVRCNDKWKKCEKSGAQEYRRYYKERQQQLTKKYSCAKGEFKGKLCRLTKCPEYENCVQKAKKGYEKWYNAFNDSDEKILQELSYSFLEKVLRNDLKRKGR